jgi:hypothetical protein
MCDYTGNGGSLGTFAPSAANAGQPLDGAFVPSQSVSGKKGTFVGITDGVSNTLMIGEKWIRGGIYITGASSCNDDQGYVDGWDNDTITYAEDSNNGNKITPPVQIDIQNAGNPCSYVFGTIHVEMQSAFCDGSVHGIRLDVDPNVWLHLLQINDGQITMFQD